MIVLAAFRRALPLKLACSFPPLHSHSLMRALAFTLHLPSPLSPSPVLFLSCSFCRASVSPLLHIVLLMRFIPIIPPASITYTLSPFSLTFLTSSLCWPTCVSSPLSFTPSYTPFFPPLLISFPSYLVFTVHSPCSSASPSSSHHLSLFHPCQPAVMSDAR